MKFRVLAALLALVLAPLARAQYTHDPASDLGPNFWGSNVGFPVNATCGAVFDAGGAFKEVGKKQTPIDISTTVCTATVTTNCTTTAALPALTFTYLPVPFEVENNGHTIEVLFPAGAGNMMKIGADRYDAVQFHIHTPSEHLVAGVASALELHIVHRNAFGDLAVVGILFDTTLPPNALIEQIIANAPMEEGVNALPGLTIDPNLLLPAKKTHWAYSGSLTTPPCTEGVRWTLFDTKLGISAAAVAKFRTIVANFPENVASGYDTNARPVRPVNGRSVFHSK